MRIAALYDIHGNLPALEAVVREMRLQRVDQVVVGGDVLPGPMPRETLKCLLELGVPVHFIHGNGEVAVLAAMAGPDLTRVPEQAREAVRWTADQLEARDERVIASWPLTLRLDVPGLGNVLFCHATPRNENECFTRTTPEDRLLPVFEGVNAALVVCGHTHMQFDRLVGPTRVVNAGSVGMPFGEPGADWLLLAPGVQLRRTAYDIEGAADRIRNTSYPRADEFAARYILQPPSEQQMLDVFAKAELKP
jgi:predicted phosphodiesterase